MVINSKSQKSAAKNKATNKSNNLDKIVKILTSVLVDAGYQVRREELKRGFGWKVVSGSCRLNQEKLVFVDRRMNIEDQVLFLNNSINVRSIEIKSETKEELESLGWQPIQQEIAA
jgi:hypothetical protein